MKTAKPVFLASLAIFLLFHAVKGQSFPEPNPEEIIKEFLSTNPSNDRLLAVLEKGAKEPYKTELTKKILAQKPSNEEAGRLLAQKPPEPYAQQAWKIIESNGTLRDLYYVLNRAASEYQDKAFALTNTRKLIVEEYIFYPMQGAPQKFVRPIWEGFMKLNPNKAEVLSAAANAKGDFQELALLYLLTQKLTASEFDSVLNLISEIDKREKKKKEEKLIEIMTLK